MKAAKIIADTTRKVVSAVGGTLNKNAPTILIFAGAAGVIAGTVLAVKAGMELEEKTLPVKENLDSVREKKNDIVEEAILDETGEIIKPAYTKYDYAKDLTYAYAKWIFAHMKILGPPILTALLSLLLIFKSHQILEAEYAKTCASLLAYAEGYEAYRKNVIESEGLEADEKYRLGLKTIEEELPVLDKDGNPKLDKNGNPKKIKSKHNVIENDIVDPRTVLWDEITAFGTYDNTTSDDYIRWKNNVNSVMLAQTAANNILIARSKDPRNNGIGYIYLNEVLKKLGMLPVDIGQIVGWRYDPRLDIESERYDPYYIKPSDWGDNKVDFGLSNPDLEGYEDRQRFISGREEAVILYMNYDGIICDKVCRKTNYINF